MTNQVRQRMMSLDINITERLKDRLELASAYEGVTVDGFLEQAVLSAVIESERRHSRDAELYRDAAEYPYKCDHCPKRFKLPMHRARHVQWSHPEAVDLDSLPEPEPEPEPESAPEPELEEVKFKVDPSVADLMDEFDARFNDDIPRLD